MSYAVNSPEFSLLAAFELRRCLALPLLAVLLLAVLLGGGCASVAKNSPESKDSQSSLVAGDVRKAREEREQKFMAEFEERRDTAQYHAAMSRLRVGDTSIAQKMLEEIVARNATNLPARLALAEILLEANQPERALELAKYVIERAPQQAAPHHVAGLILEASGRTDEALAHFQQAADLDASNEVYRLSFQTAAEAVATAPGLLNQPSPSDVEGTLAAATDALQRGAPEESVRLLSAALKIAPDDVRLLRTLGLSHYRRGRYGEAQVVLAKAVSLDTTDPLSYFLLGATLRQMGQTSQADEYSATAARLDSRYATWR
jgi:tetratricopeptide (TPR) repeat protein